MAHRFSGAPFLIADGDEPHGAQRCTRWVIDGARISGSGNGDVDFHERECRRLLAELEASSLASTLPDEPSARAGLNDLLVRARMSGR